MARTTGLHAFTVQEAVNLNEAYSDWNYEELDLSAAGGDTSSFITNTSPAKKFVLYHVPTADATDTLEDNDLLSITINGETDTEKVIKIDEGDLPFTLSGLAMSSVKVVSAGNAASDSIAILSFH